MSKRNARKSAPVVADSAETVSRNAALSLAGAAPVVAKSEPVVAAVAGETAAQKRLVAVAAAPVAPPVVAAKPETKPAPVAEKPVAPPVVDPAAPVLTPAMLAENESNANRPKWINFGGTALRFCKRHVPQAPEGFARYAFFFRTLDGEAYLMSRAAKLPEGLLVANETALDFARAYTVHVNITGDKPALAGCLVDERGSVFTLTRCPCYDAKAAK